MPHNQYTVTLGDERFMLGPIPLEEIEAHFQEHPALLSGMCSHGEHRHAFLTGWLSLMHRSLRFANANIDNDALSIEHLAEKIPRMSEDDFLDSIRAVLDFSQGHYAKPEHQC